MTNLSKVEVIFFAALEKGTPEERAAYLNEACQDAPDLRLRVERLLQAHGKAGDFLEQPPAELCGTVDRSPNDQQADEPDDNLLGSFIGPYKLLEKIGEGGMGVVYMADQQVPVRRRVALKIIKPGMDSRQIIARFEAERQALAMMDHPHIARVLDAGATNSGIPYFVMELVRGIPITEYCDQNNLPVHERLELLTHVCHAVQHAHQKGVIHRDIKPSNVLVTLHDGHPVPKVIDFGIAKALNQQLTDKTLFTNFAQMIGTPLYMSPEQAEISGLDIDTRADVYSLGVLLYELLTGTTPFDKQRFREAAFDEIRRIIREEEPERPSTRISTSGERRTAIAAHRKADPNRLSDLVRGDLDWIVMKSLEKDRTRRYETVDALARDVQRYLSDLPVEACPPTALYRFRKFARRNRVAMMTGALLLATLLAGVAGSTWQAVRATRAERIAETARAAETKQREKEQAASQEANKQRELAELQKRGAERLLYAAQIGRAHALWDMGDVLGAWKSLDECAADLRGWEYDYLHTLFTGSSVTITIPGDQPFHVISPDAGRVAGTSSGTGRIWNLATGREIVTLEGDKGVRPEVFSPNGREIAGLSSGRIVVWNAATGRQTLRIKEQGGCRGMVFSSDGARIAGLVKESVKVWDVTTGEEVLSLAGQHQIGAEVSCFRIAFSPDGRRIAACGLEDFKRVKVWDVATGAQLLTLDGHTDHVVSVVFSPDGQCIASVAYNDVVKVWDAETGKETITIVQPHKSHERSWDTDVVFSPDSQVLASTTQDGIIWLWDRTDGHQLLSLKGHKTSVKGFAFTSSGKQIASIGSWGVDHDAGEIPAVVKIWDAHSGERPLTLPLHTTGKDVGASSLAFSPDGKRIVTDTGQNTVMVWDAHSGEKIMTLVGHESNTSCVAISPDGRLIASGSDDTTVKLWDARSGHELRTLKGLGGAVESVTFSPDGQYVASKSMLNSVTIWYAHTGEKLHVISLVERDKTWGGAENIAFNPDGQRLIGVSTDGELLLCDVSTGNRLQTVKPRRTIDRFSLSPDGRRIASASSDHTIALLDAQSGQELSVLKGHSDEVTTVAFSPDGRRITSGAADGLLKLWDAETGQELLTLRGHTEVVASVAFSPDGRRLASASRHDPVMIWDATRRESGSPAILPLEATRSGGNQ